MLRPYVDVLRTPGALPFSSAALLARLPMSMFGLGIVLAVSAASGGYEQAGLVSGAALLGQASMAPVQARLADRLGQGLMLGPVLAAHGISLGALILLVDRASLPVLVAVALLAGATLPSFGSLVRARWARLHTGTPRLHTAYAFESVLDEFVFVVGPPLVTVLATSIDPRAGLAACLILTISGGAVFAAQRSSDPGPRRIATTATSDGPPAFPVFTIAWVVVTFVFMGGIFGSIEVVTVAFADELGNRASSGIVLAVFALGSLLAGVIAGAVQWQASPRRRFVVGQLLMALAVIPLPFVTSLPALAIAAFVAGFAISPTLIAGFSLVEAEVPAARLTEGLAWVSTALSAGVALGAVIAGPVIDRAGASTAFTVAVGCGFAASAACVIGVTVEKRRQRETV
ncbi:MAG: MFS transporter [Jiangellaceae bacterium]